MARSGQKGFTLLELMVALGVVAILTAIAIPAMSQYRLRAYEASAMTYMKSWVAAQELYLLENGQYATADEDLDVLEVPNDTPYEFSIDSGNNRVDSWHGTAEPKIPKLPRMTIDETGIIVKSG